MDERVFLGANDTPLSLMAKCNGLTDIQSKKVTEIYHGKWMTVSGHIDQLSRVEIPNLLHMISISLDLGNLAAINLGFEQDIERLEVANIGEFLVAEGELFSVSRKGIGLTHCKLLKIMTQKEAIDLGLFSAPEDGPVEYGDPSIATTVKTPIAPAELERFAQLYLQIWGDTAIEGKALDAIRACYPNHSIGRDPFFSKFREMRGPGKRGNPAFRGK